MSPAVKGPLDSVIWGVPIQQEKREINARMGAFQWAHSRGHKSVKMYKSRLLIEQKFQLYLNLRERPWQLKAVGPNLVWSKGWLGSNVWKLGAVPACCQALSEGLLTLLGDFLVSVSAEKCSVKEMVLVSDVHMQGCHSLVILQRLVLLLTSC